MFFLLRNTTTQHQSLLVNIQWTRWIQKHTKFQIQLTIYLSIHLVFLAIFSSCFRFLEIICWFWTKTTTTTKIRNKMDESIREIREKRENRIETKMILITYPDRWWMNAASKKNEKVHQIHNIYLILQIFASEW